MDRLSPRGRLRIGVLASGRGSTIETIARAAREDDVEEMLTDRGLSEEQGISPAPIRLFAERRLRLDGRRVRVRASA